MTHKQLETSREIRQWVKLIGVVSSLFIASNPELRNYLTNRCKRTYGTIKQKFDKES